MERVTTVEEAYKILNKNMIGFREIKNNLNLHYFINFDNVQEDIIKFVPYTKEELFQKKNTHLLILVIPDHFSKEKLNYQHFRDFFGLDPQLKEPCFYNQDWYINENFYKNSRLKLEWLLVEKKISKNSRGIDPSVFKNKIFEYFTGITYTYIFFVCYVIKNEILWKNDYVWCSDYDSNGDQIYVGRYIDTNKINKNGFSIHRHLKIKNNYGISNIIK